MEGSGGIAEYYWDRVCYELNDSQYNDIFNYNYLEKLGEAYEEWDCIEQTESNTYTFLQHSHAHPNSMIWLGFRGYLGDFWHITYDDWGMTHSPKTPYHQEYYYTFITELQWGNESSWFKNISWINALDFDY